MDKPPIRYSDLLEAANQLFEGDFKNQLDDFGTHGLEKVKGAIGAYIKDSLLLRYAGKDVILPELDGKGFDDAVKNIGFEATRHKPDIIIEQGGGRITPSDKYKSSSFALKLQDFRKAMDGILDATPGMPKAPERHGPGGN